MVKASFLVILLLSLFSGVALAQTNESAPEDIPLPSLPDTLSSQRPVKIDHIFILGNRRTRPSIILREVDVTEGEVYRRDALVEILEADRNKIFNTSLFTTVRVSIVDVGPYKVDIIISLQERWYTFPVPIFSLADRNFNDWWVNQEGDLSRVEYGLKFYQYNMRGRNERLKLQAQFGFTQKFELGYRMPYIDRAQKNGLNLRLSYLENNSVAYQTLEHKLVFLDLERPIKEQWNAAIEWRHRNSFYTSHNVELAYRQRTIADTLAMVNPGYFLEGQTRQRYFYLEYRFTHDKRDIRAYPLHGYLLNLSASRYGLGMWDDIDLTRLNADYVKFWELDKNLFFSNDVGVQVSLPERQPYNNFAGLGYSQSLVRGYELYVIPGQHYFLNRSTLRLRLFEGEKSLGKLMPLKQFRNIPIAIYLKTYLDQGYVVSDNFFPGNEQFSNTWLGGTGIGLDIVTFYDGVIRLEYSLNNAGEAGFFLHMNADF
ncbi:BamA/TamA family outer membrane protein [Roseivirga sp. BDSF3-8]|uniref:BamA/TamA family outer membrane protein n=1 Tax=Roseivirga sp. BDSF3-8 TaxID=3241598 RepID=UPI003531D8F8